MAPRFRHLALVDAQPRKRPESFGSEPPENLALNLAVNPAVANVLKQNPDTVLRTLTPREQRIIQLRFGLIDDRPMTLEQVEHVVDLSGERIRHIEAKAMSKLRHPSSSLMLLDFLE